MDVRDLGAAERGVRRDLAIPADAGEAASDGGPVRRRPVDHRHVRVVLRRRGVLPVRDRSPTPSPSRRGSSRSEAASPVRTARGWSRSPRSPSSSSIWPLVAGASTRSNRRASVRGSGRSPCRPKPSTSHSRTGCGRRRPVWCSGCSSSGSCCSAAAHRRPSSTSSSRRAAARSDRRRGHGRRAW